MRNKINPTAVTGKPINLRETCLNSEARVKDCYACIHYWCHMQSFSLPIIFKPSPWLKLACHGTQGYETYHILQMAFLPWIKTGKRQSCRKTCFRSKQKNIHHRSCPAVACSAHLWGHDLRVGRQRHGRMREISLSNLHKLRDDDINVEIGSP